MRIIEPDYKILTEINGHELEDLEKIARTCYKTEDAAGVDSAKSFCKRLIMNGHEAMLEHKSMSVKLICDRASSHDLVRHRMASFAQESTRYCNYSNKNFGKELTFIDPCIDDRTRYGLWASAISVCEYNYLNMIALGATPQEASLVLPNSLKTELIITANYREWRHIFKLRALSETGRARPQIEKLMQGVLIEFHEKIPVIFDDLYDRLMEKRRSNE